MMPTTNTSAIAERPKQNTADTATNPDQPHPGTGLFLLRIYDKNTFDHKNRQRQDLGASVSLPLFLLVQP